jgi:hypothetical protein
MVESLSDSLLEGLEEKSKGRPVGPEIDKTLKDKLLNCVQDMNVD